MQESPFKMCLPVENTQHVSAISAFKMSKSSNNLLDKNVAHVQHARPCTSAAGGCLLRNAFVSPNNTNIRARSAILSCRNTFCFGQMMELTELELLTSVKSTF